MRGQKVLMEGEKLGEAVLSLCLHAPVGVCMSLSVSLHLRFPAFRYVEALPT